ncbi:MAG: hypothetical protein SCH70_08780 [Candidatus Methanoperedens sp.]|nr:hypothetical protein [Candidatus Methanoperedens sp.]
MALELFKYIIYFLIIGIKLDMLRYGQNDKEKNNFVRTHLELGKTPAEEAGLKVPLSNNRLLNLISLSNSPPGLPYSNNACCRKCIQKSYVLWIFEEYHFTDRLKYYLVEKGIPY